MDWKIALTTFASVFLAEIGDKTQLMTLAIAGGENAKWSVFIGAALALISTTAIAVLMGEVAMRFIPLLWLRRGAGVLFVVLGAYFLWATRSGQAA